MKKALHVIKKSDINTYNEGRKLLTLEGRVSFCESRSSSGSFRNIELKILADDKVKNYDVPKEKPIWLRGDHRINVGENIRIHFEDCSSNALIVAAYEILDLSLHEMNHVLYRHSQYDFKFVDEG